MKLRRHLCHAVAASVLLNAIAALAAQTCSPGELRVVVIDSQESSVSDAKVTLDSEAVPFGTRSTQTTGLADFEQIPCGTWNITVAAEGFDNAARTVQIASAASVEVRIIVTPKMQTASIEVKDTAPLIEQVASENNQVLPAEVQTLPSNPATVNDTLPLVPSVVRDRNGDLKIEGTGQERSTMVVNQTDFTDPATGRFGQSLPVDAIESVNVLTAPFLAQYGRFTQSVVAVETRRGGEKWHAELEDPFPDFRVRSDHFRGIRNETPRFVAGGPLIANRLYVISSLQYVFDRPVIRTLPYPYNESKTQSINSFTQLDLIATPKQFVTATLHISPQHTNFVNPDYFNPQPVTPSYAQHNYAGTLIDHFEIFRGILDSSVSIQRFDVTVGAQGGADMVLTPGGNQGNFFGRQSRSARRTEWLETWSLAPLNLAGAHLLKMGTSVTGSGDQGAFSYRPADILNAAGQLEERIAFTNQSSFNRTDLEVTAYAQDHWALTPRFSVDYGGRFEHQRLASSFRVAPRGGFAWSPFQAQTTVLRLGYGLFYDHLPLDIYTFGRYPIPTATFYAPDGSIVGAPIQYTNVIGSAAGPRSFFVDHEQVAGAFTPRGATLNFQIEHSFAPWLRLRGVYTDSRSVGLVVLEPDLTGTTNEIVLNGDGKSRYRQAEITAKFSWKDGQELTLAYTRSRAEGNLNTFDTFLGNFPTLLVRPNVYSNLPADIPNRFILWGRVNTHVWGLQMLPIVEYRNGFPYARLDAGQNYVGVPYSDSTRFPNFLSADVRMTKDVKVRWISSKAIFRFSLTVFNITNHFNALAVHDNIADPQYGIFFGNYPRLYRPDFDIVF